MPLTVSPSQVLTAGLPPASVSKTVPSGNVSLLIQITPDPPHFLQFPTRALPLPLHWSQMLISDRLLPDGCL